LPYDTSAGAWGVIQDELAVEQARRSATVKSFERRRPSRKPFPDHLPRERVVIPAPETCPCYGSAKLSALGEDIADHALHTSKTQKDAIDWARKQGHNPLVARVRHLNDKKIPDHWRSA